MAPRARGSERLAQSRPIPQAQLDRLIAIARSKGVKVVDWHILGQPAVDALTGSLQVRAAGAGRLIQDLLRIKGLRPHIEIFPHGTPVPSEFQVRIRV